MSCNKVYIGMSLCLELQMHNGPDGFIFTVFNKAVPPAAATPYDFTGLTDLFLKIYAPRKVQKRTELLVTIDQGDPGVEVSGNVITWNSDYDTDIGLFEEDTYYYELSWVNAAGKLITIAFDGLTII